MRAAVTNALWASLYLFVFYAVYAVGMAATRAPEERAANAAALSVKDDAKAQARTEYLFCRQMKAAKAMALVPAHRCSEF